MPGAGSSWSPGEVVTFRWRPDDFGTFFPNLQDRRIRHTCRPFLACVLLGFCVQGTLIDLPIGQPPVAQTVLPIGRVCVVCCNAPSPQIAKKVPTTLGFGLVLADSDRFSDRSFVQRCSVDRSWVCGLVRATSCGRVVRRAGWPARRTTNQERRSHDECLGKMDPAWQTFDLA